MKRIYPCLFSLVILHLLLAAGVLAQDAPPTTEEYRQFIAASAGKHYYGVYFGDQKAGWLAEEQSIGEHEGQPVAVVSSEGILRMSMLGATHVMEFRGVTKFALSGDGPLVYVEEEMTEDGVKTLHVGRPSESGFVIESTIGDRKSNRTTDAPKETLRRAVELDRWLSSQPERGATFESFSFSLEEDDVNVKETITFHERLTIPYGGVPTTVNRVEMADSRGITFDCELAEDGRLLKGKMGPLDIRAEEAEIAKKPEVANVDFNIRIDRDLGDPELVDRLVLEVEGLGDYPFPQSHRQKLRPGKNGAMILELTRDRRSGEQQPLDDAEREKHLKATTQVQSEADEIRSLAKEIVGDEQDTLAKVDRLRAWVYDNLAKSTASNSSSALQVLDRKAGDCTEHTLLFVALARAAGIPAREVGGVAFTDFDGPIFGWHAWAQVHDGAQWVTVDPTWNQTYVDATHIQFQDDAGDMTWIKLLDQLRLRVVESQAVPAPEDAPEREEVEQPQESPAPQGAAAP